MRLSSIKHEFVEFVPAELAEGVLYISIPYTTAVHKCACGCGNKVVTPISPAAWHLIFDGDTVSLRPSIGNWNFGCRSHYWIKSNQIRWAAMWTDKQIAAGRMRDDRERGLYFARRVEVDDVVAPVTKPAARSLRDRVVRIWRWFKH